MKTVAKVLVTGAAGLIGRPLSISLGAERPLVAVDLRHAEYSEQFDFRSITAEQLDALKIEGVIHLAAVSRVAEAHKNPIRCWRTNALATQKLLSACSSSLLRPWFLFASSREVYGEQLHFPVSESALLSPVNIYGLAKLTSEQAVLDARCSGLRVGIVRLSNVYGAVEDHTDRVVPAFAIAAIGRVPLYVEGPDCEFDFTHVEDIVCGLRSVVTLLEQGERNLPPIHFVTGRGTTLDRLAQIAISNAGSHAPIVVAPKRNFDVARFVGDPGLAKSLLGWTSTIAIEDGLGRLMTDFAARSSRPSFSSCF